MKGFTLSPEEAEAMQSSDDEISSFIEGEEPSDASIRKNKNFGNPKKSGESENLFNARIAPEDSVDELANDPGMRLGNDEAAAPADFPSRTVSRHQEAASAAAKPKHSAGEDSENDASAHLAKSREGKSSGAETMRKDRYAKAFYADKKDMHLLRDEEEEFFASSERAGDLKAEVERDEDIPELGAKRSFWLSPLPWILLLILGFSGLQTVNLISSAFSRGAPEGYAWSFAMLALFVAASLAVWREGRAVLMFEKTDRERELAAKVAANGTAADALAVCKRLKNASKTDTAVWNAFVRSVQPHYSPSQVFSLYERNILSALDEKAKKIIVKRSRENGVIVALSPVAWLDMALTLARSLRMIREIAAVYGYIPGIWGRIRLYKRVVKNIIFIGAADLATDALVDVFGAGIVGKLSSALGQGVAASVYSSRLGYMTVKAVRPLPFDASVLSLGDLRREMLLKGKLSDMLKDGGARN